MAPGSRRLSGSGGISARGGRKVRVGAAGDGAFRERARRGAVRVTHLIWLAVAFWLVKQPSSESLCLWDGTFSSCRYLPCAGTATWDEHEHEHEHVGKRSGWVADRAHVHVKALVNCSRL